MYGKFFASCFTGSMMGAGPVVFAVWGYVIANACKSTMELNPKLLATMIGCDEQQIVDAIAYLCAPDPASRTKDNDGRRLTKEQGFQYFVVNHDKYRKLVNEEERREYFRDRKRIQRNRIENVQPTVQDNIGHSTMSHMQKQKQKHMHMHKHKQIQTAVEGQQATAAPIDLPLGMTTAHFDVLKRRRVYLKTKSQGSLLLEWAGLIEEWKLTPEDLYEMLRDRYYLDKFPGKCEEWLEANHHTLPSRQQTGKLTPDKKPAKPPAPATAPASDDPQPF